MKKGSGFEKFFKGREKTGAAKKENIRQEKREIRKEREEKIANAKREKRAKYKAANSGEPPKYNLEPPGSRFKKKQNGDRDTPSYRKPNAPFKKDNRNNRQDDKRSGPPSNNKRIELNPKRTNNRTTKPEKWDGPGPNRSREQRPDNTNNPSYKKTEGQNSYSNYRNNNKSSSRPANDKRIELTPRRSDNRTTKPEKWDGPGPNKDADRKPYKEDNVRPYKAEGQNRQSNEVHKQFKNDKPYKRNDKIQSNEGRRPYKSGGATPYRKEEQRPYKSENPKPVVQKKELPKKIGYKDKAGDNRRHQLATKAPINRPHTTDELMPLNKYIAHSGVCSRRDAVDLIKGGKVKVNGELILEPGHKVAVSDDVQVAGKKMNPVKDFVYILLNKPKDYITTTDDPQERKTVLDLLKGAPQIRIYPVGRLDRNTSGVLLLTNDGDLSQKLTHPSNEIKKVYAVTLDKPLTKHHFEDILKGVQLEDGIANVDTLAFTDAQDHTQIGVEIHTGRNRIVRRIFEHFGYDVKALDRVMFAGLTKKNVDRSKWRYLTEKEVRDLKFFKKGRG